MANEAAYQERCGLFCLTVHECIRYGRAHELTDMRRMPVVSFLPPRGRTSATAFSGRWTIEVYGLPHDARTTRVLSLAAHETAHLLTPYHKHDATFQNVNVRLQTEVAGLSPDEIASEEGHYKAGLAKALKRAGHNSAAIEAAAIYAAHDRSALYRPRTDTPITFGKPREGGRARDVFVNRRLFCRMLCPGSGVWRRYSLDKPADPRATAHALSSVTWECIVSRVNGADSLQWAQQKIITALTDLAPELLERND